MPATPSGADVLANTLLSSLVAGKDFSIPDIDLSDTLFDQPADTGDTYGTINPITVEQLTTGQVDGDGVFDKLMVSLVAHLKIEYEASRISGAEYTKAYIGMITAALSTSTQFLLTKDSAYWQSLLVQKQAQQAEVEAIKARVELAMAKVRMAQAQFEASTAEANYALTKLKLSTEDVTYDNMVKQGEGLDFTNDNILPKQATLLFEQTEVQRSQTLDTRTDGATVAGSVGKQKDLYSQQITSYQRDAETKMVKLLTDVWITQKTIDEGLLAPNQFTNAEIDIVMAKLRSNLALTT
jgi:hypothetical protein